LGQIQNLEDLINFLQRRFWLILGIFALGVVLAGIYAKSRPDTYEASAVIEVQSAQIAGTEASGSAQLLQSIEQRLTTRENLQAVIDRHGLYADLPGLSADERIGLLRQSITFLPIAAAGANPYAGPAQISAIVILARDGTADLAARIANDFAQGVLDLSSTGSLEKARDTMAFYLDEETRLKDQITALEAQVADYKNANDLAVPGVAESLRDESQSLETEIRALDQSLVALIEEQRQLSEKGNLRSTEKRRLQELDAEIAVLVEQKSALTTRQEELAGFERELEQLQGSLEIVAGKLTEAETDAKLAERQQTERFALLERALTPEYPMGSGGKKLFVAGAIASLMAAVGLAFVLDLLKPIVRTSAQMERQLGLRPIVAIPELDLPGRPRRKSDAAKVKEKVMALPTVVLVCSGLTAVLFVAAALS
jgi:tyrosine-protein kinase Etk/Wzc